jgi:hypothetical protein
MSTLTGKSPKDTYKGLIKTQDNDIVNTDKTLTDGDGNTLPMSVSPTSVGFSGDVKDNNGSVGTNGQVLAKTTNGLEWTNRTFTFNQNVSTATWTINHNLGMFPSVSVIDSVGNFVTGNIDYIDDRNLEITFKSAFKGKAYLN